jgi:hypothetical protein
MFFRKICLWSLAFISSTSFAASIFIEIPALSSQLTYASAKLIFNQSETTKTLYYNDDCYKNIFFVNKPGLYKVEVTIKLSSGEILSDWATGYINADVEVSKIGATINPNCFSTTFSVFWVSNVEIDQTDLYGLSLDSSLIKRATIPNIDSIAASFYDEGLNWYAEYEVHDELLDSNLIPLIKYSSGYFRNAITTCQTLLAFHSQFKRTGDSLDYVGFLNNANWLVNNNHSGYYLFEFDFMHDRQTLMKKNWVSAMAQGYAVGSLSYAYYVTQDSMYIKEADSVFVTLHKNSSDFWCFLVDNKGYYWLEEYPNKDFCHVLNGKMAALWGIFQYYAVSRNKLALVLFESGIKSIMDNYRIWNLNKADNSYYCLHHRIKDHYHAVHQAQLLAFANRFKLDEFHQAYYCFIDSTVVVEPKVIQFTCLPESREVRIDSPDDWYIEEQTDWLFADTIDNRIIITVDSNLTNQIRSATVEVIFDNGDREEISITQEMQLYFTLSSNIPEMDAHKDTLFLPYYTNVPNFEITPLSDWLRIDTINHRLRLICEENQSFDPRNFKYAITYDSMVLSNLMVNQRAKVPFIYMESDTVYLNSDHIHEVKVHTNIPRIALLSFDDWLLYDWNNGYVSIRATYANMTGRIYLDSPYLTKELIVISGEYTSVNEIMFSSEYNVYPNPVHDQLHLTAKNYGTYSYEFRNLFGTTLESGIFNESATIDVSNYNPGIYFVVITTAHSSPYVVKIIVQ